MNTGGSDFKNQSMGSLMAVDLPQKCSNSKEDVLAAYKDQNLTIRNLCPFCKEFSKDVTIGSHYSVSHAAPAPTAAHLIWLWILLHFMPL